MRLQTKSGLLASAALALALMLAGCTGGVGPTGPTATSESQPDTSASALSTDSSTDETTSEASGEGVLSAACQDISESMSSASAELGSALQNGLTDTESVKEAVALQAEALQNAASIASHPEVKTALQAVADDMGAFSTVFQDLPDMSNPASWANDPVAVEKVTQLGPKMQAAAEDLNTSLMSLMTLCGVTP